MSQRKIGILHPGDMGVSIAASAKASGNTVYWASEGRSEPTRERAEKAGLVDVGTLSAICKTCSVILSVCPPHAAEDVAIDVLGYGFKGLYLDANAISPERTCRIGQRVSDAGAMFVDGGIIGGPAWEPGTWLYLSGPGATAAKIAGCFTAGPLETAVIGETIGKASALKMCYAAYTKGTSALLSAILATAETLGVREELETQWSRGGSDFAERTQQRVRRVSAKAWRFVGEMDEIAVTFRSAGLPGGFHEAAAEIYRSMEGLEKSATVPPLEQVLGALLKDYERGVLLGD
jgi:3-hydroxyisobutyrate dehydrogenase-like beta-hydroxyacid dehydrogenase